MSVLKQICDDKREHVRTRSEDIPLSQLEDKIQHLFPPRDFRQAIAGKKESGKIALIAEIKRASPSRGVLRWDFDPAEIAKTYGTAGATCLSVLTDTPYFHGKDEHIEDVKSVSALPVLRKDFIIDPYQIYESRAIGADCILLILAALEPDQARELYGIAKNLSLDALVEVHNMEEIELALDFDADMIGVNNRDLETLTVDLQTALDLVGALPENIVKVAESGIRTHEQVEKLYDAGFNAILVGEHFMREEDIHTAVCQLLKQS
jgi:indole-3-glycerol phosphate synthase